MGCSDTVPQLSACCCGCKLRTGSKFVGWSVSICGTLAAIYYVVLAIILSLTNEQSEYPLTPEELQLGVIACSFMAVLYTVKVVLAVLLLIGVYKGRLSFYWPWMIFSILNIVISLLIYVVLFIRSDFILVYIITLIGPCVGAYFTLVIYSDYRDRKQDRIQFN